MDPIQTCNFMLDNKKGLAEHNQMLAQGASAGNYQQTIGMAVRCQTNNGTNTKYWEKANKTVNVNIICKGGGGIGDIKAKPQPKGPSNLTTKAVVTKVSMSMHPGNYTGSCPAKLQSWITIDTNGATPVKYRFESEKGALSPVYTADIGPLKQKILKLDFNIGKDPSGQGGVQNAFQAPQQGGGQPGINFAAQPTAPNVWQGFYKLKIVEPNVISSNPANYRVTCKPKIAAGNGIKANPVKPKPGSPKTFKANPEPAQLQLKTK
jgi:hypothetical protein